MKSPRFWWVRPPSLAARLLLGLGACYGWFTARRMGWRGAKAGVPVICVGNFVVGGAGKTPTALALATALRAAGHTPAFLTRGYGGTAGTAPLTVNPAEHDSRIAGDEAMLLARLAPTIVAADRVRGAAVAEAMGASIIIMDDGLQNPSLAKDFTLAVMDGARGNGNGLCLPAGPLRAPADVQARQVDAILAIGLGAGVAEALELGAAAGRPVFRVNLRVEDHMAESLAGQKVLAFAGIGHPEKFFETLNGLYAKIDRARAFADHHAFTDEEAQELLNTARSRNLRLVTTEKDAVRLKGSAVLEALAAETLALPVRIVLPPALIQLVLGKISAGP